MKKRLSIAIPTYNRAGVLKETLDTLIANGIHTLPEVDIMVRDNASTDNTFDLLTEYHEKYGITVATNARNYGFSENYGALLKSCTSDYLLLISDEDPVLKSGLDVLLNLLSNNDFAFATTAFFLNSRLYRGQTVQVNQLDITESFTSSFYISGLIYNTSVVRLLMPRIENYLYHPRCIYPQAYLATLILAQFLSFSLPIPVAEKRHQAPGSNFGEYWKPEARRDQAAFYMEYLQYLIDTSNDTDEKAKYETMIARGYPGPGGSLM